MVALDTGFLIILFGEKGAPDDRARVNHLIETLDRDKTPIIIPTPVLAEYLVRAGSAASEIVGELRRRAIFRVESFDVRAAIECAVAMRTASDGGDKRRGSKKEWAAVKFDFQIVAIAKVNRAKIIYASDGGLRTFARQLGLQAFDVGDLPLPEAARQGSLDLSSPADQDQLNSGA